MANFIGSTPMNLLPATVAGPDLLVHGQRLPVPPGVVPGSDGTELTVGIRPEYLDLMVADRAGPIGRDTGGRCTACWPSCRTSAPPRW